MKNPLIRCVALLALLLGHIGLAGCAATQEKHAENDSIDNELADARYDEPEERVLVSDDRSNGKASKEIACWGDSMTEGAGRDPAVIATGDGVFDASYLSYPDVLQKLTGMTTCNFGVSGATSEEIGIMQGAIEADDEDERLFIDDQVAELAKQHTGTILVLEMGSNGGWDGDYATLIEQYHAIIENSGCENFIIIGDTDDPGTSFGDPSQEAFEPGETGRQTEWEAALTAEFGDRFINMRQFLIDDGLAIAGLTPTREDAEDAAVGCISLQLRSDWTHLNSYGYYAKAQAVYQRGVQLGYW